MLVDSGKRFVAFFDLLGFGSWLDSDGSQEVFTYVRGFLNLMIRASLPGSVVHPDMTVTVNDASIGFINFSDSIVFYSRDDSLQCLDTMLRVSGEFMNAVITGPSRMLRGGIAFGDFFADPEVNAYVGEALIAAYKLEGAQEWLGCSLAASVTSHRHFHELLTRYPQFIVRALVPLSGTSEVPYALNWADKEFFSHISFNAERGLDDCERRAFNSLTENEKELKKLIRRMENTRAFVRHYNSIRNCPNKTSGRDAQ